jgi:outer membrane receptor protein involved in Fe transport
MPRPAIAGGGRSRHFSCRANTPRADSDGGRDIEIFGVINNLFDRAPEIAPPITTGPGANSGGGSNITNPTFYDSLGRRYRVGVRFRF